MESWEIILTVILCAVAACLTFGLTRLLDYLRRKNPERYRSIISKLGLRK